MGIFLTRFQPFSPSLLFIAMACSATAVISRVATCLFARLQRLTATANIAEHSVFHDPLENPVYRNNEATKIASAKFEDIFGNKANPSELVDELQKWDLFDKAYTGEKLSIPTYQNSCINLQNIRDTFYKNLRELVSSYQAGTPLSEIEISFQTLKSDTTRKIEELSKPISPNQLNFDCFNEDFQIESNNTPEKIATPAPQIEEDLWNEGYNSFWSDEAYNDLDRRQNDLLEL